MSEVDDGGPAFPGLKDNPKAVIQITSKGMSLRDWLVGQAFPGVSAAQIHLVVGSMAKEGKVLSTEEWKTVAECVACTSMLIADEYLRRRKGDAG